MSAAAIFVRRAGASALRSTGAGVGTLVRGGAFKSSAPISFSSMLARYYASKSFPPHTVIKMPALSPTMTSGNIGAWNKKPGDTLSAGDVLVEIETDKAQMDFEFQEDGVLAKILVESGEKDVAVGNPIAVYVEDAADVSAFADFTTADAGGASKPAKKAESSEPPKAAPPSAAAPASTPPASRPADAGERIFASPLARRIALERGIPLNKVKGTGENGRITKEDVENYTATAPVAAPPAAAPAAAPVPAYAPPGATYTDTPLSAMRKTIATRLTASKNTNPHYYVQSTLNVSKLVKLRAALNAAGEGKYKLSINDFIIKACASALLKVPQVNSSYLEAEGVIRQYNVVDISVAVATPVGLVTPIVKSAHARGLESISTEVKALSGKAREGKLMPEEYQGGTFTISNMGMNPAVERFTAIINPPQAAILAVGTIKQAPVKGENGEVLWEEHMTVGASFDHRAVDGAVGAEFMKALKEIIENPLLLLI